MDLTNFLFIFLASALSSFLFTPWVGKLAKIFNVIQYPPSLKLQKIPEQRLKSTVALEAKLIAARRRLEKPPVAEWGGIAYIIPFLVISVTILLTSRTINIFPEELNSYLLWFISILILFLGGVIDDKYELNGKVQLFFQSLAAMIFVLTPIDLSIITNPLTGLPLVVSGNILSTHIGSVLLSISFPGDIFLFIWIMILINAIKWQGGTDALMEGNVFVGALLMFIVSFIFVQPASALFSIVLAGCLLGFIYYNFYPAKIMSGSSGKSVLGFIVASLAIISNAKFAISLIIFAVPLIDMTVVLARRVLEYRPKSIFQLLSISDRSHLHHKLMKLGFSEVQIALLEYGITAIMGTIALLVTGITKVLFVLIVWITIFIFILVVTQKANERAKRTSL